MTDLQTIDLDKLAPGPETDALVAECVMRWEPPPLCDRKTHPGMEWWPCNYEECEEGFCIIGKDSASGWQSCIGAHIEDPPEYSIEIAAAWEVVEKMIANGLAPDMDYVPHNGGQWECIFIPPQGQWVVAVAPTAPMAICLAALTKAKKDKPEGD